MTIIQKIRLWLAGKLIGQSTVVFWIQGKGTMSQCPLMPSIVPDIYINGKSIVTSKYKQVTLVWGKKQPTPQYTK